MKINNQVMQEALSRQGAVIRSKEGRRLLISGTKDRAEFLFGGEGLVHLAQDLDTGTVRRIKCFWTADSNRLKRSRLLAQAKLPDLEKAVADSLGGAPYEVLHQIGQHTPFAVVMKNVQGSSWKNLKEHLRQRSKIEGRYPPVNCPSLKVRATWAYGLATAVLNMEKRQFIHADLSDGNIMLTSNGPNAGDMALVDFDSFVHPGYAHPDSTSKGTEGYAAPEIYASGAVRVGSDRLAMALLIQEFLVVGDPSLTADEAFEWKYEQSEICSLGGGAYDAFARLYPPLARLVVEALRAGSPEMRPSPEIWRPMLKDLATEGGLRPKGKKMISVVLQAYPLQLGRFRLAFGDSQRSLDLTGTEYGVHATLERNADGSIDAIVHPGATIQVLPRSGRIWRTCNAGDRIVLAPDTVLFDSQGRMNLRIEGQER